jgi:tripartite-type tricarboxylate transporter receptor subunit TctC
MHRAGRSWATRRLALGAFATAAATLIGASAQAQDYPARPIQVIVPFAGGSASDVVTRIMLDRMAKALGQPFIVDNRPGAGGNTGTLGAVRTAPDGYTLVMSTVGPLAANRTLFKSLGYDPEKDFTPISLFAILPNVVVINSKLPPKTLTELVAYARQHPKELNYGTVGVGSSQHLAGAYFEQVAGVQLVHVPYRNIAQYTPDFIAGQVPLGFQFLPNVVGMLSSGDARALAVTSPKRMTALPNVPTAREAGMNYETFGWLALLGPAGMPKPLVDRLHKALEEAVSDPSVRSRFVEQGAEPVSPGPEELQKFIVSEAAKWKTIIQKAGIEPM